MKELRIVLLGFGSANRALARMLLEKSESSSSLPPYPPPTSNPNEVQRRFEHGEHIDERRRRVRFLRLSSSSSNAKDLVVWRVVCIVTRRHGRVCIPMKNDADVCGEVCGSDDNGGSAEERCEGEEVDLMEALRRAELDESSYRLDDSCLTSMTHVASEASDVETHASVAARPTNNSSDNHSNDCGDNNDDSEAASHTQATLEVLSQLGRTKTANIVAEAIPSDPYHGEPAVSFLAAALKSGMHVASANKGPIACSSDDDGENDESGGETRGDSGEKTSYASLQRLARQNHVSYLHESAVMDGVPLFSLWKSAMPGASLKGIRGCLNSTTTVILSHMEETGGSFEDALAVAKEAGIVEEDEGLDVDGKDAAAKLRALLVVLSVVDNNDDDEHDYGGEHSPRVRVPSMKDMPTDSIRNITSDKIREAYADGRKRYRLVASAKLIGSNDNAGGYNGNAGDEHGDGDDAWDARVKIELLPPEDPLYNLSGTSSSVQFITDVLGPVTIVSTDPTLVDTAYGLFADILRVAASISIDE